MAFSGNDPLDRVIHLIRINATSVHPGIDFQMDMGVRREYIDCCQGVDGDLNMGRQGGFRDVVKDQYCFKTDVRFGSLLQSPDYHVTDTELSGQHGNGLKIMAIGVVF